MNANKMTANEILEARQRVPLPQLVLSGEKAKALARFSFALLDDGRIEVVPMLHDLAYRPRIQFDSASMLALRDWLLELYPAAMSDG